MSLRVGVNLLWMVPGEVGGSEEYSVRLLEAFARARPDDIELVLFVNNRVPDAHPTLAAAFPTVVGPSSSASRPGRVLVESTWLVRQTRAERLDLVHHLGGTMPWRRPTPGLVTIHDLQPWVHPQNFSAVKRAYLRMTVPPSARRAAVVTTLSAFVKADVVARLGVDGDRVVQIPPGLDQPAAVAVADAERVLADLDLSGRGFVIYPAITYPHKNHVVLVRAFAQVVSADPEARLVLTGGVAGAEPTIAAEIDRLGLEGQVIRTGRLAVGDFNTLFGSATAMAFPSIYEGFGMPALEAMSRGVPVVAAANTALPEVLGGAGLLVDPDDIDGWATALTEVLGDTARRADLAGAGRVRAAEFDWDRSAAALADAYRRARP